ncbi:hypothetical protein [Brucella haematophila]|uniref:hypothetical protein n=2 Tax=Brucellaceae TaxID=118882 RepID=UPI00110F678E|nr:hypothetical protein [Brucella haematophila]TMU86415.1 hypothetical protein FGI60_25195 [Brucella haematophila]
MNISQYDSNRTRSAFADTDFGMIIRSVLVGAFVVAIGIVAYSLSGNASTDKADATTTGRLKPASTLDSDVAYLKNQVSLLRSENQALRDEIDTLTAPNGVVDTIIGHLRELKAKDQAIMQILQPAEANYALGDEVGPQDEDSQPVMGNARHQIVTPRQKAPPVPQAKPAQVAEAPEADRLNEKGAAASQ